MHLQWSVWKYSTQNQINKYTDKYHNTNIWPKYSESYAWTNSLDPVNQNQTAFNPSPAEPEYILPLQTV